MSVKKPVLGRGFDGLIPSGFNVGDVATPSEQVKQLPVAELVANPGQPRKSFDEDSLQELANSIQQHGIIQPLVVTPHEDKYRIVAGERRYRAAQIAKLKKVPAIIRNHKELEELEIALVENVQRVDLSPLEQAASIVRLRDQFSLTPKDIAHKLGKAETTISNIVRLLQLPDEAVEALQKNTITEGHARAILALKTDETLQKKLLNNIITQKLSVREAETFVHTHSARKPQVEPSKKTKSLMHKIDPKIKKQLKLQEHSTKSGKVVFSYKNPEELEAFLKKLN